MEAISPKEGKQVTARQTYGQQLSLFLTCHVVCT